MERQFPIYTAETACQDCYKCLRQCPVKAIRVENGHARVTPSLCITCGSCVEVCPAHAKKIRNDLSRARHLLGRGGAVYASLAPSWVGEFPGVPATRMVAALKYLGFAGVSETALGAQEVSATVARSLAAGTPGIHISSACPAAVSLVRKYLPVHSPVLTQLHSPVMAHCALLRRQFGPDIHILFFGPCIAKKNEADTYPELLDLALTFEELREWFTLAGITPAQTTTVGDAFVPETAAEGALYPIEGGMTESIRLLGDYNHVRFVTVSGVDNIRKALTGLDQATLEHPVFVEALACEGGCIGGPCATAPAPTLAKRMEVEDRAQTSPAPVARTPRVDIERVLAPDAADIPEPDPARIQDALRQIGKKRREDELNCSGCGYNSCREFAAALVAGSAEPSMCVSYMRDLAHKKANALLRSMPSGVVIVDADLRIVECNERFGRMFGEEVSEVYDACPGLKNCSLEKVLPFADMFRTALTFDREVHYDHYRDGNRLLNITIFTLEPGQVVGAVILDVTRREMQRDQIAQRAQEVIRRNLSTVQEIACRLGEHMADTEILLRSIAEGYAADNGHFPLNGRDREGAP